MNRRLAAAAALVVAVMALGPTATAPAAAPSAAAAGGAPAPTRRATCGPGSRPEPDLQGRAPRSEFETGTAQEGYRCNLEEISQFGTKGGYKVHRYVDKAGRECAYYDSTLLFPGSLANRENLTGVYVLDMTDPAKPVKTANLVTPAMQSPHESLELNQKRGLLVANMGYPTFNPGFVDVYDLSEDCRHPVLKSSTPLGIFGHESGFAPDGRTFYSGSNGTITALDIEDPSAPRILWVNRDYSPHGMRLSADGNRLYIADLSDGLVILDVSEVQARKAEPEAKLVSQLEWDEMSIPQVAIPVTIGGRPYLVEIDEFATDGESQFPQSAADAVVGAARIIDISDEAKPQVVSNIRLEVNNPDGRAKSAGDPGASSMLQGYTGHYCAVPRNDEPGIVACSFVASGLRVFDIRDPLKPKEIAYFNKPSGTGTNPNDLPSSYAMSASAFVAERGEIWYLDGNSGLHVLRATNGVWPFGNGAAAPAVPADAGAAAAVPAAPATTAPADPGAAPADANGEAQARRAAAGASAAGGRRDALPATGGTAVLAMVAVVLAGIALALRVRWRDASVPD